MIEFQRALLQKISASLGLTYEQLSAEHHDVHQTVIIERYRAWGRYEEQRRAEMQRIMQPFIDRVYWSVAWAVMVPRIIGYDPQRLLPAPR